jgi:hypothetical protein
LTQAGDTPKPHLVPLTNQAIEIIQSPRVGRYVFPSDCAEGHDPFLPNTLTGCIDRTGFNGKIHGMRTTFRNWGADSRVQNLAARCWSFASRIA